MSYGEDQASTFGLVQEISDSAEILALASEGQTITAFAFVARTDITG